MRMVMMCHLGRVWDTRGQSCPPRLSSAHRDEKVVWRLASNWKWQRNSVLSQTCIWKQAQTVDESGGSGVFLLWLFDVLITVS